MNRFVLLVVMLCGLFITASAQQRLSAPSRAALQHLNAEKTVQAFITHDDSSCLEGLQVNMRYGDVALVSLPARQLQQVAARRGVRQLALASRLHIDTDSARSATMTDAVHQGTGLDQAYNGNGVVLGVIDTGIDFNHLAFRDSEGIRRIERVYCPTMTDGHKVVIAGDTLPGSQFVNEEEISNLTTDDPSMTHGTHTLGIAGGTRVGPYSGMAPGARLVAVAIPYAELTDAMLVLGARYIADYAKQLGLPCVISISIGDHLGPHDGTSPTARAFDEIAQQGVIIVQSAGNEANKLVHLHKDFNPLQGNTGTWVTTVMRTNSNKAQAEVDAWSSDATPFSLELQLYDTRNAATRFTLPPVTSDTVFVLDNDPDMSQYATGTIDVRCGVDSINGRFHIYSVFDTRMTENRDFWVHTYRCDTIASMDAWNADGRSRFEQMGRYDWKAGDGNYSINDIATGHNTISVGSYAARSWYQTVDSVVMSSGNTLGEIAASSSYGILPDGRSLPIVAAPGVAVISSVSNFYTSLSTWCFEQADTEGEVHRWSNMSGTSMSAPCAAGIIALWMQACPTLTPSQVRDIIAQTSVSDAFTAQNPVRWGAGKINALEGIKMALAMNELPVKPGDVNGDGTVDIADVNAVINMMLGKTPSASAGDVTNDGNVDISDVNIVINIMLGK